MSVKALLKEQRQFAVIVMLAVATSPAWSANCAAIQDADQRAYCRAIEQRSPARCVEIQDFALRQRCRVMLGDNPAQCNTISDPQARELCRARA